MPSTKPSPRLFYYWDSNVFISYLEATPSRIADIDAVLEEVRQNDQSRIYTSALAIAEVAFVPSEKLNQMLDQAQLMAINDMWESPLFEVIGFNTTIARLARDLVRSGITHDYKLRAYDATHLATAMWLVKNRIPINEFHTYDTFNQTIANVRLYTRLKIEQPKAYQPAFEFPT